MKQFSLTKQKMEMFKILKQLGHNLQTHYLIKIYLILILQLSINNEIMTRMHLMII